MKRIVTSLVLAVLLACCVPAHADEASRQAKVEQLFTLMHMDRTIQEMTDGMMAQMTGIMKQQIGSTMSPQQKAIYDDFVKQMSTLVTGAVSWKQLEPEYVKLYAQDFSDEELDGLIAFYKSPTGQAFVEKTPELTRQSNALSQERVMALMPKIQELAGQFAQKMMAAGTTAPGK